MMHRLFVVFGLRSAVSQSFFDEPNPPEWPDSVKVFSPDDENITGTVERLTKILTNVTTGHYSDERLALLFKPGVYKNVTIQVGYYTQVLGLGVTADDVIFRDTEKGVHSLAMGEKPDPGSLDNFWRGAENFRSEATDGMFWAVSQAAPLRRVHVTTNLSVYDDPGWASGGFMANCHVEGHTLMGGQQQWFTRNCDLNTTDRSVMGGSWNLVFVGTTGAPATRKPDDIDGSCAITNVPAAPMIAEKPFITLVGEKYYLQVPPLRRHLVGASLHDNATEQEDMLSHPFERVFVAVANSSSQAINEKLADGYHVVLTPGIYHLQTSIVLSHNDQVLLGIGMATLVAPSDGTPCVKIVSGKKNVRVAGLMLQANIVLPQDKRVSVSTLLEWGDAQNQHDGVAGAPGVLSDIFARVGGPDLNRTHITVDKILVIHSDHVIADNLWLWRADHSLLYEGEEPQDMPEKKAKEYHLVTDGEYAVATGLEVFGNDVIAYGLMVEHTLEHLVHWHGEGGEVYFFQSEFPYGVSNLSYCDLGYAAYKVDDAVKSHQGFGLGAYSYFRDFDCMVQSGFQAPETDGIRFTNIFARYLNGHGGIEHVLNKRGAMAHKNGTKWWEQALTRMASSKVGECPGLDCPDEEEEEPKERHIAVIVLAVLLACSLFALVALGLHTRQLRQKLNSGGMNENLRANELAATA